MSLSDALCSTIEVLQGKSCWYVPEKQDRLHTFQKQQWEKHRTASNYAKKTNKKTQVQKRMPCICFLCSRPRLSLSLHIDLCQFAILCNDTKPAQCVRQHQFSRDVGARKKSRKLVENWRRVLLLSALDTCHLLCSGHVWSWACGAARQRIIPRRPCARCWRVPGRVSSWAARCSW